MKIKPYKEWSYATRLTIRILAGGLLFTGIAYVVVEFIVLGPTEFFHQLGVSLSYIN